MNKNPTRPKGKLMDNLMSKTFNPLYKTDLEKYREKQKKITKEIFEE
jgi:hypothetical protein